MVWKVWRKLSVFRMIMGEPTGAITTRGVNSQPTWSSAGAVVGLLGGPWIPTRVTTACLTPRSRPMISPFDHLSVPHLVMLMETGNFTGGGANGPKD